MKKIYTFVKHASLFAFLSVPVLLQAQNVRELNLYDFKITNMATGEIYSDDNFEINATHSSNNVMDNPINLDCLFSGGSLSDLKYFGLYDSEVNNNVNGKKAYLDIKFKGSGELQKVEVIGFGEGSSAYSQTNFYIGPNTINGGDYYQSDSNWGYLLDEEGTEQVDRSMLFYPIGDEKLCGNETSAYVIPDEIYTLDFNDWSITPTTEIRKTINQVRLEWTSAQFASVTNILGIKLTYIDDTPTGIERETDNLNTVIYKNGLIKATYLSDIYIYTLTGSLQASVCDINSYDMSNTTAGVYMAKVINKKTGETKVFKIIKK